jgi:hypothetical protein
MVATCTIRFLLLRISVGLQSTAHTLLITVGLDFSERGDMHVALIRAAFRWICMRQGRRSQRTRSMRFLVPPRQVKEHQTNLNSSPVDAL